MNYFLIDRHVFVRLVHLQTLISLVCMYMLVAVVLACSILADSFSCLLSGICTVYVMPHLSLKTLRFISSSHSLIIVICSFTCGLTCYRSAERPNPKKCSGRCWEMGCSGECLGGCSGGCLGGCSGAILVLRKGGRAPSRAPSQAPSKASSQALFQAPHLGPALPQARAGALFRVWGFGTSVAGQATRNCSLVCLGPDEEWLPLETTTPDTIPWASAWKGPGHVLSGPVLGDTARLSQRCPTSLRAMEFLVLSTWPTRCDIPLPFF